MNDKMRAWILRDKKKMVLEDRPMPAPKDDEVLIKIKSMGICGSDLHFYTDLKIGDYATNGEPLILGHECSGEIVAVGKNCKKSAIGDRVIVEPGIPCMKCDECRAGRYNFCHDMFFMGTPPWDGCFCEYVAWPEFLTYKMPDEMSYQEGAMIEPFVVGLQGVKNSGLKCSDNAVVVGCGAIGMMTIEALKAAGAGRIIAIDMEPMKLDVAQKIGATDVINPKECDDVAAEVRKMTDGWGAQYGFECVGSGKTVYDINNYVRDGGTITYIGLMVNDGAPMPMASMVMRGLTYKSVIRYTNLFDRAMILLKYGRANILPLMTHQYTFEEGDIAFEKALNDKKTAIKVVVNF